MGKPTLRKQISIGELYNIRHDYEAFVRDKVYELTPSIQQLPIEPAQAKKMLKMPSGYSLFASAMDHYNATLKNYHYIAKIASNSSFWNINSKMEVSPSDGYYQYVDQKTRSYAESKRQVEFYYTSMEVINLLNRLKELASDAFIIPGIIHQGPSGFVLKKEAIKNIK